jgi:hypothetical protein
MYLEDYLIILCGIAAVFFLNFRNPNKRLILPLSIFLGAIFLSMDLFYQAGESIGRVAWIISASGLIITFVLRVRAKEKIDAADYLKLIIVLLLASFPITYYSFYFRDNYEFLAMAGMILLPCAGLIYIYMRWVFIGENRVVRFLVILGVQFLIIVTCLVNIFYWHTVAKRAMYQAEMNAKVAIEARAAAEVRIAEMRQELGDCKSSKQE